MHKSIDSTAGFFTSCVHHADTFGPLKPEVPAYNYISAFLCIWSNPTDHCAKKRAMHHPGFNHLARAVHIVTYKGRRSPREARKSAAQFQVAEHSSKWDSTWLVSEGNRKDQGGAALIIFFCLIHTTPNGPWVAPYGRK